MQQLLKENILGPYRVLFNDLMVRRRGLVSYAYLIAFPHGPLCLSHENKRPTTRQQFFFYFYFYFLFVLPSSWAGSSAEQQDIRMTILLDSWVAVNTSGPQWAFVLFCPGSRVHKAVVTVTVDGPRALRYWQHFSGCLGPSRCLKQDIYTIRTVSATWYWDSPCAWGER